MQTRLLQCNSQDIPSMGISPAVMSVADLLVLELGQVAMPSWQEQPTGKNEGITFWDCRKIS